MTPGPDAIEDLPPMPVSAPPLLLPGLLYGLGLRPRPVRRPVPGWITDPDLIADIEAGLIDIPDDLNTSQGDRP